MRQRTINHMTYDVWIMGAAVAGIAAYLVVRKIREDQP